MSVATLFTVSWVTIEHLLLRGENLPPVVAWKSKKEPVHHTQALTLETQMGNIQKWVILDNLVFKGKIQISRLDIERKFNRMKRSFQKGTLSPILNETNPYKPAVLFMGHRQTE